MDYQAFLETKEFQIIESGFKIDTSVINNNLFDFQKAIVQWAVKKGKCAIVIDCGMGKSFIQCEWARIISDYEQKKVLILAPLSVAHQTIDMVKAIGLHIEYVENQEQLDNSNNLLLITNYERLHNFTGENIIGVVADESSILKSIGGKIKNLCFKIFEKTKYKMSCSATPSPNDIAELANQVQFLGIMKREEMLAKFFLHKDQDWIIKGHAKKAFYKWLSSFSIFARKPSDLGFDDNNFTLNGLSIHPIYDETGYLREGELFTTTELKGIQDRLDIRRKTMRGKIQHLKSIIENINEQFIIWCGLNEEADILEKELIDAVQLSGKDMNKDKVQKIDDFKNGKIRILITKAKIAGWGLNFQNCHNMVFLGLSDSYESYYQCIRRCYRFGQEKNVNVYVSLNISEQGIFENILKKEKHMDDLYNGVINETSEILNAELHEKTISQKDEYTHKMYQGINYTLHNGDSCDVIKSIENESIDMMIYSPPFASLYTYSNSYRDLGNSKNYDDFFTHLSFLTREQLRILKTGRVCCVHCSQIPAMKVRDGYIGLKDFRGDLIRHYESEGFIYHGEVCIWKNPQSQSIRTHAKGLSFSQLEKDSSHLRPALADYILIFRKNGNPEIPVDNTGEINNNDWIKYASPIWSDVIETDVLSQSNKTKSGDDEKHICPLQLETIRRCILLYSNKGELIFSPFAGIGSEGYVALQNGRRFIGIELKPEYAKIANENLAQVEDDVNELTLF